MASEEVKKECGAHYTKDGMAYTVQSDCRCSELEARREAEVLRMAVEMVAAGDAFFTTYQGDNPDGSTGKHDSSNPKLCLLMNDVWQWASADGETVEWADVPGIYDLWKAQGSDGLLVWACKKRNMRPQKPLFDKLKPEVQAQLKDLPRAGDIAIPVGDGKVAVFDDGWKDEA